MHNIKKSMKNKFMKTPVTTTSFLLLTTTTILIVAGVNAPVGTTTLVLLQPAQAFITTDTDFVREPKAPAVVTGDNIYIAWWTNNTANNNEEVMFRASSDGGATFGDKINLSNTTDADSWRVEIAGEGENVVVSWWETNQTSDIPVARVSNDGGETFGPLMMLAANGTLGSGEAEAVGGETVEEEAVGGPVVAE
jgi:hypothetical protein